MTGKIGYVGGNASDKMIQQAAAINFAIEELGDFPDTLAGRYALLADLRDRGCTAVATDKVGLAVAACRGGYQVVLARGADEWGSFGHWELV